MNKDTEVLAIAAQQQRILISHDLGEAKALRDRKTMPSEFAQFITNNQSLGVIIVSRKVPIEIIIEELILIWAVSSTEEWINRIAKIPL
ncbi:hypothetical protein [Pleurocapsa sp. PCC 7319]|uniref:hypothetical protein n=1 Tax=Pleurocapsa sp. PCC 7319 TaxID=118161 RepID=UPI000348EDE8|nr:hypothetical protein [Pleurocapsa sp. PCC 7319]